jgi:hypothetical protein
VRVAADAQALDQRGGGGGGGGRAQAPQRSAATTSWNSKKQTLKQKPTIFHFKNQFSTS